VADAHPQAQQGCSRVCTGPSASTLGQEIGGLTTSLRLGQYFLLTHRGLPAQHSAVGIRIEHQPHQEHVGVILHSQAGHSLMAEKGTGLQFFHFPFAQRSSEKIKSLKISLRVPWSCLLLLAFSSLENKGYLSCWFSLAQGGSFAITPGMAIC